jgi:polar amino acid transport system substrate-binding protein
MIMTIFRSLWIAGLTLGLVACSDSTPVNSSPTDASTTSAETTQQAAPAPEKCELVMGWDPWEPYQYEISGGHVFGLDVDLLTAVTRNAGCDIAFEKGSWRELLMKLRDGEIDMLAGATNTADRGEFAWFTDPYRDEEFYLYVNTVRVPELGGMNLEQILQAGLNIGVIDDYLYGDKISAFQDDPAYQAQFQYSSMAETNVSKLLDGKVDAIIEDKFVGASIIRHKNLANAITPHEIRFGSTPVSIMISKASVDADLFARLNDSVDELRRSGAIDMVLTQYQNP